MSVRDMYPVLIWNDIPTFSNVLELFDLPLKPSVGVAQLVALTSR